MAITLVLGKKGSGKSALVRKICSAALRQRAALFYHDPQAQISASRGRVYTSIGEFTRDPRPTLLSIFREVDVEAVAGLALRVGSVSLILDEMDEAFRDKRYASPHSAVRRLIHYGRHHRVCVLGAFRRTQNVSEDLVSQCDRAFLFRITSTCPQDLHTVRNRFGERFAEAVQGLDFGQCVLWQDSDSAAPARLQSVVDAVVSELPKRPAPRRPARNPADDPAGRPKSGGWLPNFFG